MKLTRRGETLLAVIAVVLSAAFVIAAFFVGQEWKQDRIEKEQTSVGMG